MTIHIKELGTFKLEKKTEMEKTQNLLLKCSRNALDKNS